MHKDDSWRLTTRRQSTEPRRTHRVGIIIMRTERHYQPKEELRNTEHMFGNYALKTQNTTMHGSVNGEGITRTKQGKLIEESVQES